MTPPPAGADVVVIGGGLVGASVAYELVTAGASTVLVDRHDPGRATDAGAGILSPETGLDPDPASFAFGVRAARHYESLTARLVHDGGSDTGFAVTGSLVVAERPGDDQVMEDAVRLAVGRCPSVEEVDPVEAGRLFPPLGPVRRALYNPAGRRVDGRVLLGALSRASAVRGLRTIHGGADGIEVDAGAGTVTAVTTSEGRVPAGAVVIAGGAWSPELGRSLGVELPVTPLKGQIIHLHLPDCDAGRWPIVQPVLGFYLVPWPDGQVACGGTMEAGAGYDHRPTADGVLQLLRECLRTAPGLAPATVVEVRVGSRPSTPDGHPVLGPLPGWSNAFVATGHGAEGLLLGPYSGMVVARAVLGVEEPEPGERNGAALILGACSPDRFT